MNYKIWMGILLISTAIALPFVSSAKQPKREANGVLIKEQVEEKKEKQERIAECGFSRPLRVATTSNNRPFGWAEWLRTPKGTNLTSKGFGMDMFEEIAQKLKLRYQVFGYTSDQDAINAIKKGELDLLIGIYSPQTTVGRGAVPIYPAIFSNVFTVYFLKDRAFDVQGYNSLANKKGVIRRIENIYPLFSHNITGDMSVTLETTEDAFKKLLNGEADYLIGSPYSLEAELRRYKLHEKIVPAEKSIYSATMFMVLTRATDCFKLRNMLGAEVERYVINSEKVDKQIRAEIDAFGERFRDVPSLEDSNNIDDIKTEEKEGN